MINLLGTVGALAFGLCGFPQAIKSFKDGHSQGISTFMIALWMLGAVSMFVYVTVKYLDVMLMINYVVNMGVAGVMGWFKIWPRKVL